MTRRPKLLGIETDVWALLTPDGRPRGGDSKLHVYWTKARAKQMQQLFPECSVVPVRIVVVAVAHGTPRPSELMK